jgi:hypothetical protein
MTPIVIVLSLKKLEWDIKYRLINNIDAFLDKKYPLREMYNNLIKKVPCLLHCNFHNHFGFI